MVLQAKISRPDRVASPSDIPLPLQTKSQLHLPRQKEGDRTLDPEMLVFGVLLDSVLVRSNKLNMATTLDH